MQSIKEIVQNYLYRSVGSFFVLILLIVYGKSYSQITDSIPYENGHLYFHEYGKKKAEPILILTGGPGNSYLQLEEVAKKLSLKFRPILLEQRGTGKSIPNVIDSTTINLSLVTKDLKTLLEHLELDSSHIIGHSWGGMLGLNLAAKFPEKVKTLILVAPGPHKDVKRGFEILASNRKHTRSFQEEERLKKLYELIDANQADSLQITESRKLRRRAYIFANPIPDSIFQKVSVPHYGECSSILMKSVFREFDVSESLKNFKGKIEVITGRQDVVGFFSYELKIDFPQVHINWINESGHFPMYEKPEEFYSILNQIIK
ncbi:MAG: alpha/beta hydrolase [Bacteroidota bacterium]